MAETDNATAEISKVSEITPEYLVGYLRIDAPDEEQTKEIKTMLKSAIGYVSSYTGLAVPVSEGGESTEESEPDLDSKPEFVTAVVVLVQNQYDNRTLYLDKNAVEKVLSDILDMHRVNFL